MCRLECAVIMSLHRSRRELKEESPMRHVLVPCALALLAAPALAIDYHVSPRGADTNPGTLEMPFRTIQAAANMVQPGGTVYIHGGTYRETVVASRSGTAGAPIRFQPYQGAQVTVTGLDVVSSPWATHSNSIYYVSAPDSVSQVFVNGQQMGPARWPHPTTANPLRATYATIDSATYVSNTSTMTDSSLPAGGSWVGAKVGVIGGAEWIGWSATVTDHTGQSLSFTQPAFLNNSNYLPKAGNRYYLYGSLAAMSGDRQFYYDSNESRLYLTAPGGANPGAAVVEARTRQYAFDLNTQSHVEISGIRMLAATVRVDGSNNLIDNSAILYASSFDGPQGWGSQAGVQIGGQHNRLSNSQIAYSWGHGVKLTGSFNTIENNVIHDIAWAGDEGAFVDTSAHGNNTIVNNTMHSAGRSGVLHRWNTPDTVIRGNDISNYGYLTKDLGGTYGFGTTGNGTVIEDNRVHDGKAVLYGAGIYIDNDCSGITVSRNVVWNVDYGIQVNQPGADIGVYNNTIWDTARAMHTFKPNADASLSNVLTYNNLSNKTPWVGTDTQNNVTTSADPFVSAATGDFRLHPGTAPVDSGRVIPGITDGYSGTAPDAGAFELGSDPRFVGASFTSWHFPNQVSLRPETALSIGSDDTLSSSTRLLAGNAGTSVGGDLRAFLMFDVSSFARHEITDAVLRLYLADGPNNEYGGVGLYAPTSAWTEHTLTYAQAVGSPMAWLLSDTGMYYDLDVTSLVRIWAADTEANLGLSLRGTEGFTSTGKYFGLGYGIASPELIVTAVVPEPSSLPVLLGLGAGPWLRRRLGRRPTATL
jgi:hypothetical protein